MVSIEVAAATHALRHRSGSQDPLDPYYALKTMTNVTLASLSPILDSRYPLLSSVAAVNGIASLDATGKLLAAQFPDIDGGSP